MQIGYSFEGQFSIIYYECVHTGTQKFHLPQINSNALDREIHMGLSHSQEQKSSVTCFKKINIYQYYFMTS